MAKGQFNRLIWLVDIIYRHGRISFPEINRRWLSGDHTRTPIPLRTFHNHRVAIEEIFDINIECDKSSNSYYIADAEGLLNNKFKMWLLNSSSLNSILQENTDVRHRVVFEDIPQGIHFMDTIVEALHKQKVLEIKYQAYSWNEPKTIGLEAYMLKQFRQRWYVIGVNREYQAFRSYSLDRILEIQLTDISYKLSSKITPQRYFKDSFGIIRDEKQPPCRTVLRVDSVLTPYLRALPLHASQRETELTADHSLFELTISHTYDFVQELLSKGSQIEVLEPVSLRDRMRTETEKMYKMYE